MLAVVKFEWLNDSYPLKVKRELVQDFHSY